MNMVITKLENVQNYSCKFSNCNSVFFDQFNKKDTIPLFHFASYNNPIIILISSNSQ